MEKCFEDCSYAVANLLNLHTMHLHWVKKITAATVVLIGQKRILSKPSYLKSCFHVQSLLGCQKEDPEVQTFQKIDIKSTCLMLLPK